MSDTTIDDILEEFYGEQYCGRCEDYHGLMESDKERVNEAKSALYELMLSVIGEDEKLKPDENGKYNLMRLTEHQLRAEMRSKLREMFS